jgi:LmbE family N-acetylglucosaminyl deacetylase
VIITDGSAGSNEPGMTRDVISSTRKREQQAAAEVLGIGSITFLDFPDGLLEVNAETRRAVTREVRRFRPEVIVAPDPSRLWSGREYVNHADHRAAGELALCAVMPDAPSRPQFPELLDEGFEPFEVPNLWLTAEEADTFVDIGKTIDTKIRALAEHVSQHAEASAPWVRERARELGERSGVEYAEAFRTFDLRDEEDESP